MTEDTSGFENIIKEMNNCQQSLNMNKIRCANPNCKTAFAIYEKCHICTKNFCDACIIFCDNCNNKCCKFCTKIIYLKFKDVQICPNCDNY